LATPPAACPPAASTSAYSTGTDRAAGGERPSRRRLLRILAGAAASSALALAALQVAADQIDKLLETLRSARAWKVRLQTAMVLAKLPDRRVVPALGRTATADRHYFVRIQALRLLAKGPGGEPDLEGARTQVRRALSDRRADVRAQARLALAELDRRRATSSSSLSTSSGAARPALGPLTVFVASVGDRSGRASAQLRARLKSVLLRQLGGMPTLVVADRLDARVSYVIDATIARLEHGPSGTDMEIACAVQLLVSRPPRGIVMSTSGEASVLKPRSHFRPATLPALQAEALDHAVGSAYENLGRFFKGATR
jgi:hypothetical protein